MGITVTELGVSGDGVQQFVDRNVDEDHVILSTVERLSRTSRWGWVLPSHGQGGR